MKFAFILNTDGGHPDTYQAVLEAEDFNAVYGVTGTEEGMELAKRLIAEEGYDCINFCGDFTAEQAAEIRTEHVISREAVYLPEEMEKLEKLDDLSEYGLIIFEYGVEDTVEFNIMDPACNTYVRFVPTLDHAREAARKLVDTGVAFIELCGLCGLDKTKAIIESIDGKVPVGSCGLSEG